MSKVARFEVYRSWVGDIDASGPTLSRQWRWRLKGANGEIVAQGEAYTRKADCLRAVKAIRRLAGEAKVVTGKPR